MRSVTGLFAALIAAVPAAAQGPMTQSAPATPATCLSFDITVDAAMKRAALAIYGYEEDDSAPRESARQQLATNALLTVQINLQLMLEVGCRLPAKPFAPESFITEARLCAAARKSLLASRIQALCDVTRWRREGEIFMGVPPKPPSTP